MQSIDHHLPDMHFKRRQLLRISLVDVHSCSRLTSPHLAANQQVCKKTAAAAKTAELARMRGFKAELDAQIEDNQVGACWAPGHALRWMGSIPPQLRLRAVLEQWCKLCIWPIVRCQPPSQLFHLPSS